MSVIFRPGAIGLKGLSMLSALSQNQAGNVGSWAPGALGSSLLAWWDAERTGLITQTAGAVSSWRDIVGGYNCVQATGAAQPIWSATGFNSRPVVTFDGTDDELTLTTVPAGIPTAAAPSELWGVFDQTALVADTTVRHAFNIGSGAASTARALSRSVVTATNRANVIAGNGTNITVPNTSAAFSGRHVVRGIVDGTTAYCELDGNLSSGTASVPTTATNRLRIGATSSTSATLFWQGGINTVLVTSLLTTTQADLLRAYLNRRLA